MFFFFLLRGLEEDSKRIGGGSEEDWERIGGELGEDWRRIGGGLEEDFDNSLSLRCPTHRPKKDKNKTVATEPNK